MLTLQLSIVLLLILLNGFFAMAEIALVSARPARLQPLAAEGSAGAEAALELKSDPSRLLATVQIGITIIAVLSGTFGQATFGERLQDYLGEMGGFVGRYAHAIAMAVVVIAISYFSLILGELVPKRIALSHPEQIAAAFSRLRSIDARERSARTGISELASAPWSVLALATALTGQRFAIVHSDATLPLQSARYQYLHGAPPPTGGVP